MRPRAAAFAALFVCACASQGTATPEEPIAILDQAPERPYVPVWPVSARAPASAGRSAIDEALRDQARELDADAVIIERRYLDPSPAPGDERSVGLGDPYPGVLESLEPGAFPRATTGVRVYGPHWIVEGLAIRFPPP